MSKLEKVVSDQLFTKVTDMSNLKAKVFFRNPKHYINFELPPYFQFEDIMLYANSMLIKKTVKDICMKDGKGNPKLPGGFEGVNYTILSNKDGGFAWRPLQIIHPVLYGDLVNIMTDKGSWKEITELFSRQKDSSVECISIPLESNTDESSRAAQVSNWWDKIEQESLRKSIDYKFMFQTDISNCYPSIYTHSLEWAICPGGRIKIKTDRAKGEKPRNIGTEIDKRLRYMNQDQTIGIPQGSTLMDFIAEIVLAGTDLELTERLKDEFPAQSRYSILRYRDDYRVFSDEYQVGHSIMKILNDVLSKWNMKMNVSKTSETSDILSNSIKQEKMEELYTAPIRHSYQKEAMRIYMLSKRYPNSGLIAKKLTDFYDRISRTKTIKRLDYEVAVAIVTMIAYYSPKYMSQTASIVSLLIDRSENSLDRESVINKIINKFSDIPNTELIDIWLQRITSVEDIFTHTFASEITKVAIGKSDNSVLWNSNWLSKANRDLINNAQISSLRGDIDSGEHSPVVEREEFALYRREGYQW